MSPHRCPNPSLDAIFWYFLDLVHLLKRRKSSSSSTALQGESRNIVIFGSLGVGKSSLVNMLIGRDVAPVGNGIGVVHPPIVEYPISLAEISEDPHSSPSNLTLRVFDTLGLDHSPSPWRTINTRLRRSGGGDVVVYCMRRGRLSNEQVTHLRTISKTFCREGVPLVLVIGSADYRRGSTEKWWEANGEDLKNAVHVPFADTICLNTWNPDHPSWNYQGTTYGDTQRLIRDLMMRHCRSLHSVS